MPTPSLDESSLRRPNFDAGGFAVTLADGGPWRFPRIRVRIVPEEREDGSIAVGYRPVYADDLSEEIDVLFGVTAASDHEYVCTQLKVAATLLRANYDLPRGAVSRLLAYLPGDPASEAMLSKVAAAILGADPDAQGGDDPKGPTPNGSD